MFAVAFEVLTHADTKQDYLETAKALKPILEGIDGFREIDRFGSLSRPGWILSLSFWEDEAALVRWRSQEKHYIAQTEGRRRIFRDYRIRVAQVIADDDFVRPVAVPLRRSPYNSPSAAAPRFVSFTETTERGALEDWLSASTGEIYESLYRPGKVLRLDERGDERQLETLRRELHAAGLGALQGGRFRAADVERDYRLRVREEAPQFMAVP